MTRIIDLVSRLGGTLAGDGEVEVSRVAALEHAGEGDLAFLANPAFLSLATQSRAAAFIVKPAHSDALENRPRILADDPYLYFARAAQFFNPPPPVTGGVHPGATVLTTLPASVAVDAGAVVEEGAVIGEGAWIGANSFVGRGAVIGRGTRLYPNVTIYHDCVLGEDCIIHSGAVIGSDGFGFAREKSGAWVKIPQVGRVVIGNDVEIGSNTSVDRGAIDDTVIGNGVKLDNQIQIAHNVHIGDYTVIAGSSGVAGSAHIGARCMLGGQAGIVGHLNITDDVVVSARTMITKSITRPGVYTGGIPQQSHADWIKNFSHLRQLDALARKVRQLEQRLKETETAKEVK